MINYIILLAIWFLFSVAAYGTLAGGVVLGFYLKARPTLVYTAYIASVLLVILWFVLFAWGIDTLFPSW